MCLLTYFPSNRQPNEENLRNGSYINNDGHGWAIVSNGTILTGHSLNADVAIREFVSTRKTHPNGPALFHSRFTTHGSTNLDNCHPFAVNGDQRTVIGHNGILACGNTIPKEDTRSDTRFFADEILPTFKFWRKRVQRHLEGMIGSYNKIVILNVNPRIPFAAVILNEKEGIWKDGIWYSNSGFEGYSYRYIPKQVKTHDYCFKCFSMDSIDEVTRICEICLFCTECNSESEDCQCYVPAQMDNQGQMDNEGQRYRKWWEDNAPTESTIIGHARTEKATIYSYKEREIKNGKCKSCEATYFHKIWCPKWDVYDPSTIQISGKTDNKDEIDEDLERDNQDKLDELNAKYAKMDIPDNPSITDNSDIPV